VRPDPTPLAQRHQDLQAKTVAALERLARLLASSQWEVATSSGLTALQLRLLEELAAAPRRGVGELATSLQLAPPTVSRALATLASKGLVEQKPDPADRRRVLFSLTQGGQALVERLGGWAQPLGAALASLGQEVRLELFSGLLALLGALEARGLMAQLRMCLTCRFFLPGDGQHQAFCRLLERPLSPGELRLDCPDHQPAAPKAATSTPASGS